MEGQISYDYVCIMINVMNVNPESLYDNVTVV